MSTVPVDYPALARWQRLALLIGAGAVLACVVGVLVPDTRVTTLRAWLVAFNLVLGIAVGSLALLMLQWLTGGTWGFSLRRPLEAATRTLPLVTLLFLPVLFGLGSIYEWAQPDVVAENEHLQAKAGYFATVPLLARVAVYFAVWNGLAFLLNLWSRQQDEKRDRTLVDKCMTVSGPGLLLHVIAVTFFAIDFLMSLEPEWYSTIYGAMIGMGQVLSAFSFAIVIFIVLADRPPLQGAAVPQTLRDLGSLLMAFVLVWSYLSFMQFLLIWSGNLPEEVPWYLARLQHGWSYAALALVVFHFALPFALLLSVDIKRSRPRLLRVALLVLAMRVIDLLWLIVPAFSHGHAAEMTGTDLGGLLYPVALVAVGGVWLAYYFYQVQRLPLLPLMYPWEEATHGATASH